MIEPRLSGNPPNLDQNQQIKTQEILPGPSQDLQQTHGSLLTDRGKNQFFENNTSSEQGRDGGTCGMTAIALIDRYSFTRDCITGSLQAAGTDLRIVPHASCADVLNGNAQYDLLLFHWHREEDEEFEKSELATAEFKSIIGLGPVVVLGETEQSEFISAAFERGVRGYIPIRSTPAGLAIEIMRLIKAGGTFVPLSGLPLPDARAARRPGRVSTIPELTPRESAVLKLLKQGKANKIIAHDLKLRESTVKAHIRHIMRKMNVKNRTEVVCYAYGKHPAELPAFRAF